MNPESSQSASSKSKRYSDRRRDDRSRKPADIVESVEELGKAMSENLHLDKGNKEEQHGDSRKDGRDNIDVDKRKNRVSQKLFPNDT